MLRKIVAELRVGVPVDAGVERRMDSTGSQGTNHGTGPCGDPEFQEINNRGRKLPPEAIEFGAFLKTYIARRVSDRYQRAAIPSTLS
jgi:hypothetical protein